MPLYTHIVQSVNALGLAYLHLIEPRSSGAGGAEVYHQVVSAAVGLFGPTCRVASVAHGAAYATYVGSWRKRFRITGGDAGITRYDDQPTKTVRSFCARCGTPICYERARSPHMVNIPRALFSARTGRQPLYHIAIEELQDWAYAGEPLVPLKGFPGVVWQRSKKNKRRDRDGMF